MQLLPQRPVLASRRSSNESSADRFRRRKRPVSRAFAFPESSRGAIPAHRPAPEGGFRMCGIIGYVGHRASKPLLLQGLQRLEYRGYDSAGLALLEAGGLDYVRAVGNLANLKEKAGSNG